MDTSYREIEKMDSLFFYHSVFGYNCVVNNKDHDNNIWYGRAIENTVKIFAILYLKPKKQGQ